MSENEYNYQDLPLFPKTGDKYKGIVTRVESDTLTIDFGFPIEGKIHPEYYSSPKVSTFEGLIKVGDEIEFIVSSVLDGDGAIALLSRLPLQKEEKYNEFKLTYDPNKVYKFKVVEKLKTGVRGKVEGYDAFLPLSLLSVKIPDDFKKLLIDVIILEVPDPLDRKKSVLVSNSHVVKRENHAKYEEKQVLKKISYDKLNASDIVEGTVGDVTDYCYFINIENTRGILRFSNLDYSRVNNPKEFLHIGDTVTVKILSKEKDKLELSIKDAKPTPYEEYASLHNVGETVKGKIYKKLPSLTLVELAKGVIGGLHISELTWNPNDNSEGYLKVGNEIEVKIIKLDADSQRISLSKKQIESNPWDDFSYRQFDVVKCTITSITNEGIGVSLGKVDTVIARRDLPLSVKNLESHYVVGEVVEAQIVELNVKNWHIRLSVRKIVEQNERVEYEKYLGTQDDNDSFKQTVGGLLKKEVRDKEKK
ncbi:MAG: S1 RNA-binding domain-containing protein [Acholeplasmatales bacterium]|jgi:small subunit ribosomal protein S1|nr:S1 RNA-binding domain-containing protein [Acholeplasmatales bacterium]